MKIVASLYKKCEYFWTFYCTLAECKTLQHPAEIKWSHNKPHKLWCKMSYKRTHLPNGYKIWNIQKKHKEGIALHVKKHEGGMVLHVILRLYDV